MSSLRSQPLCVFALALFLGITFCPPRASADGPAKALTDFVVRQNAPSQFTMKGVDTQIGKYTCYGEMDLKSGQGVVMIVTANGDRLVGVVQAAADRNGDAHMVIAPKTSVRFSDGTLVGNTGGFVNKRPQYLVVIAIIAILIGLLLPAVQK